MNMCASHLRLDAAEVPPSLKKTQTLTCWTWERDGCNPREFQNPNTRWRETAIPLAERGKFERETGCNKLNPLAWLVKLGGLCSLNVFICYLLCDVCVYRYEVCSSFLSPERLRTMLRKILHDMSVCVLRAFLQSLFKCHFKKYTLCWVALIPPCTFYYALAITSTSLRMMNLNLINDQIVITSTEWLLLRK